MMTSARLGFGSAAATGNAALLLYGVTPIGNTAPFIATGLLAVLFRRRLQEPRA